MFQQDMYFSGHTSFLQQSAVALGNVDCTLCSLPVMSHLENDGLGIRINDLLASCKVDQDK